MGWLGFGDLDLIFKVTAGLKRPNLSPKVLVCTVSHELVDGFQPDLHGYNVNWGMMKSWFDFGDLDIFFKVSAGLKLPNLSQKVLVCTISREPAGGF